MNYYQFTAAWFLLFATLLVILSSFGVAPRDIRHMTDTVLHFFNATENAANEQTVLPQGYAVNKTAAALSYEVATPAIENIKPEKIVIEAIGVVSSIVHPETADTNVLDEALQRGVAQYPGSGYLNENSNIFLFGHSTGIPNVRNKAYGAFNKLSTLNVGDTIKLYAGDEVYEYAVTGVSRVKADEARVTFSTERKMLTLSTCNTFGKKEDRFVVTAEFVQQTQLTDGV
ncbi:MAG: hypothetical protein A2W52_03625 [Candidatus Taylorbacteria bacterium RIFCSPHIGHO2_02_49_25]|uniref:Sortase n=1 Tax=Candidatus Taylorbacteria bacterium RIFCSPHIGHO2_02_49_25 TaxID=1802305 RepID=A0A1G2MIX0_9BACT|nr:MAG: hypothetical protein A2759_01110 [Candidatus Taylorbacteria bacterium RIFCSPHIGHO2_01_FULL_49_60]OHA22971.1 MAG: hypothetical protein A2W52_03625 [Candidatus Taylorbacteria bacterium RIFCSPHIGHO2_02_49_25]OHA35970.1 MAG: hypothetical protein A3B27_02105 [Candidatus Taylorbacteria bacterium RIFCSPLOWO2_01_FULL_50_130]OHA37358.1 MAG: hypothetical protein A2W65_00460 [Candidatus Taylorbacteria bacterium RIFCSPLOWO2_02_50_13]OHA41286.1 MAG: hypothetical protein A3H73_00970 [Candidatus Taylo